MILLSKCHKILYLTGALKLDLTRTCTWTSLRPSSWPLDPHRDVKPFWPRKNYVNPIKTRVDSILNNLVIFSARFPLRKVEESPLFVSPNPPPHPGAAPDFVYVCVWEGVWECVCECVCIRGGIILLSRGKKNWNPKMVDFFFQFSICGARGLTGAPHNPLVLPLIPTPTSVCKYSQKQNYNSIKN